MTSDKYGKFYEQPKEIRKAYEDTSFIAGDSPVTLDVFDDLGVETYNGEIDCDGAGDILVSILSVKDGAFSDNFTVKAGEMLDIRTHRVRQIKITHSGTDSAYRVRVW